jgi:hypothetical protein
VKKTAATLGKIWLRAELMMKERLHISIFEAATSNLSTSPMNLSTLSSLQTLCNTPRILSLLWESSNEDGSIEFPTNEFIYVAGKAMAD